MRFHEFVRVLRSDIHRYGGWRGTGYLLKHWLLTPGVHYSIYLRLCHYLRDKPAKGFGVYYVVKYLLIQCGYRYGINIAESTCIGSGLYIGHYGGIVVHGRAIIGRNCNLGHGVTIGEGTRGGQLGYPVIGDNVFIGPGAKIFGPVQIGDRAAIGANAVVLKDVPDDGVAAGVPARIVSMKGSAGLINFTDY